MKKSYGSGGSHRLSKPPSGGKGMGGISPPKGGTVAHGATLSTAGVQASAGEKGRAHDPNCDKVRSSPSNP